jgi:hypothetical protein
MLHKLPRLAIGLMAAVTSIARPAWAADAVATAAAVDVQMSLCETPAKIEHALRLHPRGAAFEVWLFDNAALDLFAKGLRLRLRGTKSGAELTLKVAEQDCATLAVPAGEGKCEYDLHGSKVAGALSLTRKLDAAAMKGLADGSMPLAAALSPAQTGFLQGATGAWPLPKDLRPLGPARVQGYLAKGHPYTVDVSVLPGGEAFVEISRKVPAADATKVREQLEADLAKAGVPACADQSAQAANKLRALLRRP